MVAINRTALLQSGALAQVQLLRATSLTAAQQSSLDPYVNAEAAAARAMTDEQYWGWDKLYGPSAGVAAPSLINLVQQGQCGGGGCNPSFSTSQFWRANVACSPDVYARVLFQYRRYVAAQQRLQSLLANPPQPGPAASYFNDPQDSDGCSTSTPALPAGAAQISAAASQWADWCLEVMRNVAVAQWATAVRWCNGDREPSVFTGLSPIYSSPDMYGRTDAAAFRPPAPSEVGTVAVCLGQQPPTIDAASSPGAVDGMRYWPDVDRAAFGGYHPTGYFRPTTPRGSSPARWTWGTDQFLVAGMKPKATRGICELSRSNRPPSDFAVFDAFRTTDGRFRLNEYEWQPPGTQYWHNTILQLSEVLATRRGNESSGTPTWVMPESKSDFDPVVNPALIFGSGFYWPDDLAPPASSSPRDLLIALFQQNVVAAHGLVSATNLSTLRAQWQINWASTGYKFLPTGLRQIWWCMAQAYDVIDTPFGTVVQQSFANFLTGLNQMPPAFRVTNPAEAVDAAKAALQGNLNTIMAGCSAAAGVIGGIGAAVAAVPALSVALEVVAALVAVAGQLASAAFSVGLARAGNPPVMPTITTRAAGTESTTDPCWLVPTSQAGSGGAQAISTRASQISTSAGQTASPEQWYAQVEAAIAANGGPPTTATVNKGVALGAGAVAGLALIKILGVGGV